MKHGQAEEKEEAGEDKRERRRISSSSSFSSSQDSPRGDHLVLQRKEGDEEGGKEKRENERERESTRAGTRPVPPASHQLVQTELSPLCFEIARGERRMEKKGQETY